MEAKDTLTAFLEAAVRQDWKSCLKFSQKTWAEGKTTKDIQIHFDDTLKSFRILSYTNNSSVVNQLKVELTFTDGSISTYQVNVLCETGPYKPAPYGEWGVNPVSFRILERVRPSNDKKHNYVSKKKRKTSGSSDN